MMVSDAKSSEQIDADILRCKVDILRASDITPATPKHDKERSGNPPPYKKKAHQEQNLQKTGENTTDTAKISKPKRATSSRDNISEAESQQIKPGKDASVISENPERQKPDIPIFDLAEDIMAEQRKITAIKRKAPGKKNAAQKEKLEVESIGYTIKQSTPALSKQDQIIAEIVARDIERLCSGNASLNLI